MTSGTKRGRPVTPGSFDDGLDPDKCRCPDSKPDTCDSCAACASNVVAAQGYAAATPESLLGGFKDALTFAPAVDSKAIVSEPLQEKIDVPTILGSNAEDAMFLVDMLKLSMGSKTIPKKAYVSFLLLYFKGTASKICHQYPPDGDDATQALGQVYTDYFIKCSSDYMARQALDRNKVWAYQFTQVSNFNLWPPLVFPDCKDKVCHGDELPYIFDHLDIPLQPKPTQEETQFSATMIDLWSGFATDGSLPAETWTAYGAQQSYAMLAAPKPENEQDPFPVCKNFWDAIGYGQGNPSASILAVATGSKPSSELDSICPDQYNKSIRMTKTRCVHRGDPHREYRGEMVVQVRAILVVSPDDM